MNQTRQQTMGEELANSITHIRSRLRCRAMIIGGCKSLSSDAVIERNRAAMKRFETCINTNDLKLGEELISEKAAFMTPVSPTPLYGAAGYLSVVSLMRASFPDVQ